MATVYKWPGDSLGFPQTGKGSIPTLLHRAGALLIDWLLCYGIAALFFKGDSLWLTAIFLLEQTLTIGFSGASIGHRIIGMRVGSLTGKPLTVLGALVRSALLILVVPALIMDENQRGFHERLPGLVLVKTR